MSLQKYPYQNLSLKNTRGERWEDIPGLDGYFAVSNYGRIKRLEFEMQYKDGRSCIRTEKIIKPRIVRQPNKFIGDYSPFLTVQLGLLRKRYRFTITRLVYHCFVQPFDLDDDQTVILVKDADNFNIRPSNLIAATLQQRSKRIFQRNRAISPLRNLSEVFKQKQRQAIIKKVSKQVTQYSLTGKKIKTFSSMAAAGKATGVHAVAIGGVAAGKYITAGGFVWRWGKAKTIDIKSFREARRRELRKKHGQKVTQYNMKGRKVASYPSLLDAQIASGAHTNAIRLVLKGKYKSAKGYFWKKGYGKENIDLSTYKWGNAAMAATQSKKVKQYTLGGKYIQSFASVKAAAKYMGVNSTTMSGACTGYQKTCGGFKWQFA